MNLESIPKTLWHSISISIMVATIGFTYITYKAESFSLKYKGVELITQSNEARALNLETQSELLAQREKELEELQKWYDEKVKALEAANRRIDALTRGAGSAGTINKSEITKVLQEIKTISTSSDLIKEKQESLRKLSEQQQQLQEQELKIFQQQQLQQRF